MNFYSNNKNKIIISMLLDIIDKIFTTLFLNNITIDI